MLPVKLGNIPGGLAFLEKCFDSKNVPAVKSLFETTIENQLFENTRQLRYHLVMKTIVGGSE